MRLSNRRDIDDNVKFREDFGGVRNESQFYSNELCSHLERQDVARREKMKGNPQKLSRNARLIYLVDEAG
jgi:hypothetical protein